ncbi:MAG: sigma-70 family RNA polymerase sigma factor [Gemmataceae bacterium]|nr:sigma-70 family RNA polymerase sigma factor [Gemmataceae bacterium]
MTGSSLPKDEQIPATDTTVDELALFRQAQQGDFAAFQQLIQRWQPRVFTLAYRILGQLQDAEDVTQQTFLSVIEHLDQFRGESSVMTWVLRIATNHALQLLRRRRQRPTVPLDVPSDDDQTPLPHPEYIARWRDDPQRLAHDAEVRQLVEQALAELDDKYRLVFLLRDVEGLSVRETADMLGITESNVKVRLLRARLQLRERLTRMLGDATTQVIPDHQHHLLNSPSQSKPGPSQA